MARERVLIIGAGQAGARTAEALRVEGWGGEILLLGAEPHLPYERPPLSKEVLLGKRAATDALVLAEAFYRANDITVRTGERVGAIDPMRRTVVTARAEEMSYDHLVLATGCRARPLRVPGGNLQGVHHLRDATDAEELSAALRPGCRVVLVGGGFIGLEVAAAAKQRGCRVVVLEAADRLLGRVLPATLGDFVRDLHTRNGVEIRTGVGVTAIAGAGQATGVHLTGGEVLAADVVVAGIGAEANDALAQAAGIACENGVLVDEFGRTSQPGIHAVGDVAVLPAACHGRRLRLESWQNAESLPRIVALDILGRPEPYREAAWFWTDQYDVNLQIVGAPAAWDRIVTLEPAEETRSVHLLLHAGRCVGAVLINAGAQRRAAMALVAAGAVLPEERLAVPGTTLKALLKEVA